MNRYIDTDQLSEELKKPVDVDNADELWEGWHACTIAVDEAIRRTPTADVRENVKGKWKIEYTGDGWNDYIDVTCTNCGKTIKRGEPYNFCPNCGADMRGEA